MPLPYLNARGTGPAACGTPGPREELLGDAGLDRFELRVIELTRLIFAGLADNRPRYAPRPEDVARTLFGAAEGDTLHAGIAAFVQAMAISRSQPFHYSNPYCHGCARILTQDEGNLIRVLHHVRRGRTGRAITHALMICDTRPVSFLMDVAADLATLATVGDSAPG